VEKKKPIRGKYLGYRGQMTKGFNFTKLGVKHIKEIREENQPRPDANVYTSTSVNDSGIAAVAINAEEKRRESRFGDQSGGGGKITGSITEERRKRFGWGN